MKCSKETQELGHVFLLQIDMSSIIWMDVFFSSTPPKTNMDTQNDGLEKATPFKHGNFLVSMLVFRGCKQILDQLGTSNETPNDCKSIGLFWSQTPNDPPGASHNSDNPGNWWSHWENVQLLQIVCLIKILKYPILTILLVDRDYPMVEFIMPCKLHIQSISSPISEIDERLYFAAHLIVRKCLQVVWNHLESYWRRLIFNQGPKGSFSLFCFLHSC